MERNLSTFNFKKNGMKIVWIAVFIIGLIPITVIYAEKYAYANSLNKINTYNENRFNEFYEIEENYLDMVFVGSSHSYCTFDPEIVNSITGLKSYQMGMPLQHPDNSYYTILEILNYQKPKTIVMELYWDMMDDDFELKQSDMLFEVLKNEELKEDYMKNVFPINEKLKYNLDIIRFQGDYFAYKSSEINSFLEEKLGVYKIVDENSQSDGTEYYRSLGYVYCDYEMPLNEYDKTNQFKNFDGAKWEFSKVQMEYLEKIVDICKSNSIELIFVTAPIAITSIEYIENYENINEKVSSFANENNIPYIDYNILNGIEISLNDYNFRDDAHLNHSGVEIISEHFANYYNLIYKKSFAY